MTDLLRILVVDDHALVRAGLRRLVEGIPGVEVVGEASDGAEAIAQAKIAAPDIVMMDLSMPGQDGVQAAAWFARELPAVRIVMVTMHSDEGSVLAALRAGVAGYLLKRSAPEDLEAAIRAIARGERFLSPAVVGQVVDGVLADPAPQGAALTPRHRDVLRRVLDGKTSREIADELGLSVRTVEAHRAELMVRLGVRNTAELAREAMRRKLDEDREGQA